MTDPIAADMPDITLNSVPQGSDPSSTGSPPSATSLGWPFSVLWIGALSALAPIVFEYLFQGRGTPADSWIVSPATYMFGMYAMAATGLAQYERSKVNLAWKVSMGFPMAFNAVYALNMSRAKPPMDASETATVVLLSLITVVGYVISHSPRSVSGEDLIAFAESARKRKRP